MIVSHKGSHALFVNNYVVAFCDLPVICLSFSAFLSSATSLCDKKIEINVNFKSSTNKRATHKSDRKVPAEIVPSPEDRHCRP